MRVLLINPFYPISETPSPPLGLAYLAASLEQAGAEVRILDFVVYPYSRKFLEETLRAFPPAMVGVTAVTMTFNHAREIVRDVKQIDSRLLTVMGGAHVSMRAAETLAEVPDLDLVAVGEGEDTVVDLVRAISGETDWESVPGIVYRHGSEIRATPVKPYLVDVTALPFPARHLLPLGRYRALNMPVSLTTSRGCPFRCIFCVGRKMVGAKVRFREPAAVVDEMEHLKKLNFDQVNIADDLFTASRKHCLGVCDEILRRGLEMKWSSFARVDLVSRDLLARMKEAGCQAVSFGVESGNPEILETIKKGITVEQVLEAIKASVAAGVLPHASFILGLPGETPETLAKTKHFGEKIKELGGSYGFHLLAPFPGTEIRERAPELGLHILTDDWSAYHANRAVVTTDAVDETMLNAMVIEWEHKLDEWLGEIKEKTDSHTASKEEAWQLISMDNTVINYDLMMQSVLENNEICPLDNAAAGGSARLLQLAERIYQYTDYPPDRVRAALQWAWENGSLGYDLQQDRVKWYWRDCIG